MNIIKYEFPEFIKEFFEKNNLEIISKDESVKIGLLEI